MPPKSKRIVNKRGTQPIATSMNPGVQKPTGRMDMARKRDIALLKLSTYMDMNSKLIDDKIDSEVEKALENIRVLIETNVKLNMAKRNTLEAIRKFVTDYPSENILEEIYSDPKIFDRLKIQTTRGSFLRSCEHLPKLWLDKIIGRSSIILPSRSDEDISGLCYNEFALGDEKIWVQMEIPPLEQPSSFGLVRIECPLCQSQNLFAMPTLVNGFAKNFVMKICDHRQSAEIEKRLFHFDESPTEDES